MSEGHWQLGAPPVDGFYWAKLPYLESPLAVVEVVWEGTHVRAMDGFPEQPRERYADVEFWSERIAPPEDVRVDVRFEPCCSIAPQDCSPEMIVGAKPDHVDPMRPCPVCSAAVGVPIVHTGPTCEPGKPAFGPGMEEMQP